MASAAEGSECAGSWKLEADICHTIVMTNILHESLARLFGELVDGPRGDEAYMLNRGDSAKISSANQILSGRNACFNNRISDATDFADRA